MTPLRNRTWPWLALIALYLTAGCDGFREVQGPDAQTESDGPPGTGGSGPGPLGALPTGYCCTSDDQCRHRSCRNFSGVKMCSDPCSSDAACEGGAPGFRCADPDGGGRWCSPRSPGLTCRPAEQFTHGAIGLGGCCVATHDNRNGLECLSGRCVAWGDFSNPYYCATPCAKPTDCPGPYLCTSAQGGAICRPSSASYSCTK